MAEYRSDKEHHKTVDRDLKKGSSESDKKKHETTNINTKECLWGRDNIAHRKPNTTEYKKDDVIYCKEQHEGSEEDKNREQHGNHDRRILEEKSKEEKQDNVYTEPQDQDRQKELRR